MRLLLERKSPRQPGRSQPYLDDAHRCRRQFTATLRAGSLPVQACKQSAQHLRFGGPGAPTTCFMCSVAADETADHFLFHCPAYEDLRQASGLDFSEAGAPGATTAFSEQFHNKFVAVWFQQWCRRVAA